MALFAGAALLLACDGDPTDPDPACPDAEPLAFGVTHDPGRTRLGPGDPVLDGSYVDYYSVRPPTSGTLIIEMAAERPTDPDVPGVDPFLYLWADTLGDPIAQAYDPTGEGPLLRVARLTSEVEPACYRVGASGWPAAADGAYTIRADFDPGS